MNALQQQHPSVDPIARGVPALIQSTQADMSIEEAQRRLSALVGHVLIQLQSNRYSADPKFEAPYWRIYCSASGHGWGGEFPTLRAAVDASLLGAPQPIEEEDFDCEVWTMQHTPGRGAAGIIDDVRALDLHPASAGGASSSNI